MSDAISDVRFTGFYEVPPEGMVFRGRAMGRSKYDIWTNGKSLFSPDMRWALVRRREARDG